MEVLPLAYLGSLSWFARVCFGEVVIDVGEHYVRRSERSRCEVLLVGGRSGLSVPVVAGSNWDKLATREVRIDASKRWRHTHWMSLRSGYGSAPYWEAYEGLFAPVFERRFERLYDWNRALLEASLKALGRDVTPIISETYLGGMSDDAGAGFCAEPYWQVFSDRMAFQPNLSIVDLIFCLGPGALDYLRRGFEKR